MKTSHQVKVTVAVEFDCGCTMIYLFDRITAEEREQTEWGEPMVPAKMGGYWVADEENPGEPDIICGRIRDNCDLADEKYASAKKAGLATALEYVEQLEGI